MSWHVAICIARKNAIIVDVFPEYVLERNSYELCI